MLRPATLMVEPVLLHRKHKHTHVYHDKYSYIYHDCSYNSLEIADRK